MEKMGRRESYTPKSMDDLYRRIGLEPDEPGQPGNTVTEETETAMTDEPSGVVVEEAAIPHKPVFVSETVRDELDRVVRYLGGRGMSASGLIENLVRLHLDAYRDDIEQWRKL